MAQIASEDYANKKIYLHIDTVTNGFDPALMQKEHRTRRRLNANGERKFYPMVSFVGNESKGGGKFTPRSTRLSSGVRIIPYDTGSAGQYSLPIFNEILNVPDGLADRAVFDRSTVLANIDIDKDYDPVEVIQIITGSAVTAQDKIDISSMSAQEVWGMGLAQMMMNAGTAGEAIGMNMMHFGMMMGQPCEIRPSSPGVPGSLKVGSMEIEISRVNGVTTLTRIS